MVRAGATTTTVREVQRHSGPVQNVRHTDPVDIRSGSLQGMGDENAVCPLQVSSHSLEWLARSAMEREMKVTLIEMHLRVLRTCIMYYLHVCRVL